MAEGMAVQAIPQLRKQRRHKGAIWCEYILGASYNKQHRYAEAMQLLTTTFEESLGYGVEGKYTVGTWPGCLWAKELYPSVKLP